VNFSRTVWITFHWRGMTSSVSVISSPIFTIRSEPQQVPLLGASTTTRSRGTMVGEGSAHGLAPREGAHGAGLILRGCLFRRQRILGGGSFQLLKLQFQLIDQPRACARSRSAACARAVWAASSARNLAISEAVSDMAEDYHNCPGSPIKTGASADIIQPLQAFESSADCANRSLPEDSRAAQPISKRRFHPDSPAR